MLTVIHVESDFTTLPHDACKGLFNKDVLELVQ